MVVVIVLGGGCCLVSEAEDACTFFGPRMSDSEDG